MLKNILSVVIALVATVSVAAQTPYYQTPDSVGFGKELPRGDVVCYASREAAIAKAYHRSEYLVPLNDWKRTDIDGGVRFSTTYKYPFAWLERELLLHVGQASSSYDVSVNGKRIAYSQTSSTPSEFDITKYSVEGNNRLEITVWRKTAEQTLQQNRTPVEPALTGEVYILAEPKVRVRDIAVDTRMQGTEGLMYLGVVLKSHMLNTKEYKIYYELISPDGKVVAYDDRSVQISMRREDTVSFFRRIPDIMPWSHEEPCLYTLVVKTQYEGRFKEYLSFQIGFRSIGVDKGTVTLNGVPLRINIAEYAPQSDMARVRRDIAKFRDDGITMLRVKGAPQSREFYELCDSIGMYVSAAADIDTRGSGVSRRRGGNPSNDPQWTDSYIDRTESMYHSSKNYPSVIMFEIADSAANGYNLYESYLDLKRLEEQRPVVYASTSEWNSDRLDWRRMASLRRTNLDYWVAIYGDDPNTGVFTIADTRHYTPIIGQLHYTVKSGHKTVSSGSMPLRVMPKSDTRVQIPLGAVVRGKWFTIQLEVVREVPRNYYKSGVESTPAQMQTLAVKEFKGFLQ